MTYMGFKKNKLGKIPRAFSKSQLIKIFNAMDKNEDTLMMVACFCGLKIGLRVGEVCKFEKNEINWDTKIVEKVNTKNSKPRHIPIDMDTTNVLSKWCSLLGNTKYIFPPRVKYREYMYPQSMTNSFHRYLISSGFDETDGKKINGAVKMKYSFHNLRKTYTSYLINSGADIFTVASLLGHESIEMTRHSYTHLAIKEKRADIDKAFGIKQKPSEKEQQPQQQMMQVPMMVQQPQRDQLYELQQMLVTGKISIEDFKQKSNALIEMQSNLQKSKGTIAYIG